MVRVGCSKLPVRAVAMAHGDEFKAQRFRAALRAEQKRHGAFRWHKHNDPWIFENKEDCELARKILDRLLKRR
jgi:hypothetical protein